MNYFMKPKSARLRPVEKLAEDKAKSATEAMVSARQSSDQHQAKLTELMRYRNEYLEQLQSKGRQGISAGELQQYQQFISQIDTAIAHQKEALRSARHELAQKQHQWRTKDSEKRAINNAVNRFRQQENRSRDQKEQQEMDEHNIQAHLRKNED